MRMYLAGPVRGYPNCNAMMFDNVAKLVRSKGHTPINPLDLDRAVGIDPYVIDQESIDKDMIRRIFHRDMNAILMDAEALVLLPGWKHSSGAKAEVALAIVLGLPIYDDQLHDIEASIEATSWIYLEPIKP